MRLLGHPVHVMLVHFPIALWPAHAALHACASYLPASVSAVAGFWLVSAGVALGWAAALAGAADLFQISRQNAPHQLTRGLIHGALNGGVLLAFTAIAAFEFSRYPMIEHGAGFLAGEITLLVLMAAGNFVGGAMVWSKTDPVR